MLDRIRQYWTTLLPIAEKGKFMLTINKAVSTFDCYVESYGGMPRAPAYQGGWGASKSEKVLPQEPHLTRLVDAPSFTDLFVALEHGASRFKFYEMHLDASGLPASKARGP